MVDQWPFPTSWLGGCTEEKHVLSRIAPSGAVLVAPENL